MSGTAVHPGAGFYAHDSFSAGVLATGRTLHVAGQLPLTAAGEVVAPGEIEPQLDRVWEQIEAIVGAAGGTLDDVVRVTAWTTSHDCVGPIVEARRERFAGRTPPASALLVVAGLALPGALVEIDAIAVLS